MVRRGILILAIVLGAGLARGGWAAESALRVLPVSVILDSPEASDQLLVFARNGDGSETDVTRRAAYTMPSAGIAAISPRGRVTPLRDGKMEVRVEFDGKTANVAMEVRGFAAPPPVSF